MTAQPGFNPSLTTNASGSFNTTSVGLVQGTAYPDPADRYALNGGYLLSAETIPMWGGVAIFEDVPVGGASNPKRTQGPGVGRATATTGSKALGGFAVFDQAYGAYSTPQSPVPLIGSYNQVMYYRLGSGARIAVAADPILTSLRGGNVLASVSWDWVNQLLVPYIGTLTISSGTYNSTTGVVTLTMSAPIAFDPGDSVVVSALTGTGAYASLNGTFTSLAGTTGSTVVYNAGAGLGAAAITGGSLTLGSGASAAIPVKVLDIQADNCMTVVYDSVTANASWNRNGACAVIQI